MEHDAAPVVVDVVSNIPDPVISKAEITAFMGRVSDHLPDIEDGCSMEILFTDDEEMSALNLRYRNLNRTTDVLSFPDGERDPVSGRRFLGSIAISLEQAVRQADDIGHGLKTELYFLILHGTLHLLGYDHEQDSGEMLSFQRSLQSALNLKPGGEPVS